MINKVLAKVKYLLVPAIIVILALTTPGFADTQTTAVSLKYSAGIVPLTPNVDVSIDITWRYIDRDCSPYVPEGAEGVILDIMTTSPYESNLFSVRKNGSSDRIIGRLGNYCHTIVAVGVDEDRVFEAAIQNTHTVIKIVGYIPEGAGTFLTNAQDVSLDTIGSWRDGDISAYTGDETAKVAFLLVNCESNEYTAYDLRENGSTDDKRKVAISAHALRGAMVGLDPEEKFEGWINDTDLKFKLVGWLNVGYAETFPNAIEYSTDTEGCWVETEFAEVPPDATGVFLTFHNTDAPDEYLGGFRPVGSCLDNFFGIRHIEHFWCAVTDRTLEQKVLYVWGYDDEYGGGDALDLWLWGWTGGY